MGQVKQKEWQEQWERFQDNELFLFKEWIYPNTLDDFKGKTVLECGCGGGHHISFMAPYASEIAAVDLNTVDIARERNKQYRNVSFIEADIAEMNLGRRFDIVISCGVVHHTDNPEKTVENLKTHLKSGGRIILWVYSKEGNFLIERLVEPIRKGILEGKSREKLHLISKVITSLMYIPIYSIYRLPVGFLPFYDYFDNFRKLSFERNTLNVFDKLNAPQTDFISRERIENWFNEEEFQDIHISSYKGVSWCVSATKC